MITNIVRTVRRAALFAAAVLATTSLSSCKESLNEGDYAIASKQTVTEYLSSDTTYSYIKALFDRVKLGRSEDASSLSSVMSARGNYTVFAPTNQAIREYMDSLGISSIDAMDDETASLIAKSCIIDNGDDGAYETPDFPSTGGAFAISNLNDRVLTCTADANSTYVINGTSPIVKENIEVSNGMIHIVSTVISPSADNLPDRIAAAPNMQVFAELLTLTSWADSLTQNLDQDYEKENYQEITDYRLASEPNHVIRRPTHRYIGYTALVETDDVLADALGVSIVKDEKGKVQNMDEVLAALKTKAKEWYPESTDDDLTSGDNAVNRFVAYHLLLGSMPYDKFVRHLNEYNYKYGDIKNPQTVNCPTDVWNYYTTMGKHASLIKITQVGDGGDLGDVNHPIYVNRISEYDNGRSGDYHVTGIVVPGVLITATNVVDGVNYDNNAQNGFYFPISGLLINDETNRDNLARERMRIDLCTMLPEMASNSLRGKDYHLFPLGYFDNIMNESTDTKITYICDQGGGSWNDYQGDEFLFCGLFDFTLKLPPVPKSGTYEIRMGVGMNPMRGMAQIYFGSDPYRLSPAGLPYDMRQTVNENNTEIPWVADTDDDEVNAENDKNMRNHGYLKGPQYFTITDGKAETPVRMRSGTVACVRRIITVARMEPGKSYYLRFKSALKKLDSQFFLDYFEIVPSNIYNGTEAEDIW